MKKNGKSAESKSHWTDTCEAELKVWVASVMIWCIFKNLSFEAFFKEKIDTSLVYKWFPSGWRRWFEIKSNFKVSDPLHDEENKSDKMWKVRELWDDFIGRCKANYWCWNVVIHIFRS